MVNATANHPAALRSFFACDFDACEEELDALRAADALSEDVEVAIAPLRARHGRIVATAKTSPAGEPWVLVSVLGAVDPRAASFAAFSALEAAGLDVARGVDRFTLSAARPAPMARAA